MSFSKTSIALPLTEASEDGAVTTTTITTTCCHIFQPIHNVLENRSGTGTFSRRLAKHVSAGSAGKRVFAIAALGAQASCLPLLFRILSLDFSPR